MQYSFVKSILIGLLFLPLIATSQEVEIQNFTHTLNWQNIASVDENTGKQSITLFFEDAGNDFATKALPVFKQIIRLPHPGFSITASIKNLVLDEVNASNILDNQLIGPQFDLQTYTYTSAGETFACISFVPIRLNALTGNAEYLLRFTLEAGLKENTTKSANAYVEAINSVLADGTWYKLKISTTGIHKISSTELASIGIASSGLDPRKIKIYGNGGGTLPEANREFRYSDLQENAIYVAGQEDGRFDASDYILFYAQAADTWNYDSDDKRFIHQKNPYADFSYYYIMVSSENGKRIANSTTPDAPANHTTSIFVDYAFHETETYNLIKSGRQFYGELFDVQTDYNFSLTLTDYIPGKKVSLAVASAAKAYQSSKIAISNNNTLLHNQSFTALPASSLETQYANRSYDTLSFTPTSESNSLKFSYSKPLASSQAWLDYYEVNYLRNLLFRAPQLSFRNPMVSGQGNITTFTLQQAGSSVIIWDVTDATQPQWVQATSNGNNLVFKSSTENLREFIAFDNSGFYTPEAVGKVANQNLHGLVGTEYIIIAHPEFMAQAQEIAELHNQRKNISTAVVTPEQVYNEFSSGSQDVTAIRDFMYYLYNNATAPNRLKYLLLVGDASYDYKSRIQNNTNFIPTYQSVESLHPVYSYATDDYFGLLDLNEGSGSAGSVDIGIGRLPVYTLEQAQAHVNKLKAYLEKSSETMRDWRNVICFVADDQDNNSHFHQADGMAKLIDTTNQQFNVDKIYLDSYAQVSTPGGQRYPDATLAINQRVENGSLIMNYTGHGGELGWAHERVLEISDINNWSNIKNLPLFITATCEFSRYDDPERVSAGELVFLNPNGGSIAMFTTARLTYGGSNLTLNKSFLKWAMLRQNNKYLPLGDIVRLAKSESGTDINGKKFIFLGDPALELAHPSNKINTLSINGKQVGETPDTLKALSSVLITGEITNPDGIKLTDFNGTVYPTIFDKPSTITTLGNDPDSYQEDYQLQKNIIYKGQAKVTNGEFSFSFIVPRDIEYRLGLGKISYYAENGQIDASGFFKNLLIGGIDETTLGDTLPPDISLYMNDTNFVDGGITGESPVLIAYISDKNGINTVGNGIGHDLSAILDNDTRNPNILNDYYKADYGTYTSGVITFPFYDLSDGLHTLKLTVWDVFNNSASKTLSFMVVNGQTLRLENLYNYPNPFSESTNFVFEHNQASENLTATIHIYNLAGQLVKTIAQAIDFNGYRTNPIPWNGTSDNGKKLGQGFYIYRVTLTEGTEKTVEATGRLVITHAGN